MSAYVTEEMLRLKFQVDDVVEVTPELVDASIAHAHGLVTRSIRAEYLETPPEPVIVAETLLAGAALLRSLAARRALERREARLAGHQLDTAKQFPALMDVAKTAALEAFALMKPYMRHGAVPETPGLLTVATD